MQAGHFSGYLLAQLRAPKMCPLFNLVHFPFLRSDLAPPAHLCCAISVSHSLLCRRTDDTSADQVDIKELLWCSGFAEGLAAGERGCAPRDEARCMCYGISHGENNTGNDRAHAKQPRNQIANSTVCACACNSGKHDHRQAATNERQRKCQYSFAA